MVNQGLSDLQAAGYDTSAVKEVLMIEGGRGKLGQSLRANQFQPGGFALHPNAFRSQGYLNEVMEEELRHLSQPYAPDGESDPLIEQNEIEVNQNRKFHR